MVDTLIRQKFITSLTSFNAYIYWWFCDGVSLGHPV